MPIFLFYLHFSKYYRTYTCFFTFMRTISNSSKQIKIVIYVYNLPTLQAENTMHIHG